MSEDSFITGIILGLLASAIAWGLWYIWPVIEFLPEYFYERLKPPGLQLILLGIYLIFFRYLMVIRKQSRTGRGFLLILFAGTICMFLLIKLKG
ncbi:MAG: hypothetical protein LC117_04905 [Bacteroidia bacterium]|nr:hypothetical protein [Bacteroidia bacterium]MCZ2277249.1 hypothetical protein [Bacteroidia bacterium]